MEEIEIVNRQERIAKRAKRRKIALGCYGILTSLGSIKAFAESRVISTYISKIQTAETVPISDLRSILQNNDEDESKLAIVRGIIEVKPTWRFGFGFGGASAALKSSYGELDCVVMETTSSVSSPNYFGGQMPFTVIHNKFVPFSIASPNGGGGACVAVNYSTELMKIHPVPFITNFRRDRVSEYGEFESYGLLLERILPVGMDITAIGKLSLRNGNDPQIDPCLDLPFFLSNMTKEEILQHLASSRYFMLWTALVLGTVSLALLGYTLRGNWKSVRNWWMKHIDSSNCPHCPPGHDHDALPSQAARDFLKD